MNIYIKSFNRPYYLERCIKSILLNVTDKDLKIIVLDDGTDEKYLNVIQEKYPSIVIKYSPFYDEKVDKIKKFIASGTKIENMVVPFSFWLSTIYEYDDDFFIVLEDDIWFTEKINLEEVLTILKKENLCLVNLFHQDNPRLISGDLRKLTNNFYEISPKILITNPFLFEQIILKNRFYISSILRIMKLYNPKNLINYYMLFNVAGAIFSKKYYSDIWKGYSGYVDEYVQLVKAVKFYQTNKGKMKYGIFKEDILRTSFTSSATNMFEGINLNAFTYNHLLNEAWLKGELDAMSGYPKDILESDVEKVLEKNHHPLASVEEWRKWVNRFKEQYRNVGHAID